MGCDIHWYSETKKDGAWVCDQAETFTTEEDGALVYIDMDNFPDRDRDYWWFGLIQPGVRTDWPFSFAESAMPEDISKEVRRLVDNWGSDGHSHGSLTRAQLKDKLVEMKRLSLQVTIDPSDNRRYISHFITRLEDAIKNLNADVPDEDQRIVFWFDN